MIRADSKWKIYTRNGCIKFSINKDIILNTPNKLAPPDSLIAKYNWFSEPRSRKEKVLEVWKIMNNMHPNIMNVQIIQVEDYYCLISEEYYNSIHDYRMFPNE